MGKLITNYAKRGLLRREHQAKKDERVTGSLSKMVGQQLA